MELTSKSKELVCKVSQDGSIPQDSILKFQILSNEKEAREWDDYNLNIIISKNMISKDMIISPENSNEWRRDKNINERDKWNIYKKEILFQKISSAQDYSVDEQWWRDIARTLTTKSGVTLYCYLSDKHSGISNSKDISEEPFTIKISSCLQKLESKKIHNLYNNETKQQADNGQESKNGFAHHQQIKIISSHNGMYTIVQWVHGIFVQWKDTISNELTPSELQQQYRYLKIPSCGYDSDGYLPQYVHDGSKPDNGTPNFFDINKGEGIDKPGDAPNEPKTWDDFSYELMILKFETQVYLSCDVTGGVEGTLTSVRDAFDKEVKINNEIKFMPVDLIQKELKGGRLQSLASSSWAVGILQSKAKEKSKGYSLTLDDILSKNIPDYISIPESIVSIIKKAFDLSNLCPVNII